MSLEISGDRIAVRFAPPFGPDPSPRGDGQDEQPEQVDEPAAEPDPLNDPATFGGEVPGYELDDEE